MSEEARDRRNARLREKIVCPACERTLARSLRFRHNCKDKRRRAQCQRCHRWYHPSGLSRHRCVDPSNGKVLIKQPYKVCHACKKYRSRSSSDYSLHCAACAFVDGTAENRINRKRKDKAGQQYISKGAVVGRSGGKVGFCCGAFLIARPPDHKCAVDKNAPAGSARAQPYGGGRPVGTGWGAEREVDSRSVVYLVDAETGKSYNRLDYVTAEALRVVLRKGVSRTTLIKKSLTVGSWLMKYGLLLTLSSCLRSPGQWGLGRKGCGGCGGVRERCWARRSGLSWRQRERLPQGRGTPPD